MKLSIPFASISVLFLPSLFHDLWIERIPWNQLVQILPAGEVQGRELKGRGEKAKAWDESKLFSTIAHS